MSNDRNPVVLPEGAAKTGPCCPKCGCRDFDGRRIQGVVVRTCKNAECRFKWEGGLAQVPEDPLRPMPPSSYVPPVQYVPVYDKNGNIVDTREERRAPSLVQDFRRGAPVPDGEDY